MALAFNQSTTGNNTTSPVTTTAFAGAVTAGNIMVVTESDDSGADQSATMTMTDNHGNTYTRLANTGAALVGTHTVWWAKITTGAASGFTVTCTDTSGAFARMTLVAQEFTGFTGTPTFDKISTNANGTSTTPLSGSSGTLTVAAELVVGCFANFGVSAAWTLGTGYTNLGSVAVANGGGAQESKIVAATTAVTAGATLASSEAWSAFVVTFRDVASAAAGQETMPVRSQPTNHYRPSIVIV